MDIKSGAMFFSRDELQFLANCVTLQMNEDNGEYSFKDKMQILCKLNEQLDRFTMMEGEIV